MRARSPMSRAAHHCWTGLVEAALGAGSHHAPYKPRPPRTCCTLMPGSLSWLHQMMVPVSVLPVCAVIVAVIAGSGGVPLSCPPDTICLKDYNKEELHRLKIECRNLTVILDENGSFGGNVFYDKGSHCVTWRDGILSDCAVTETDENGRKSRLPIAYSCTAVSQTTTAATTTPGEQTPTSTPSSRHHWAIAAAFGAFVISIFLLIFYGKCIQENLKEQIAPQKIPLTLPP